MSKFSYKLQNILSIKEKLENLAKMEYAIARNCLTEEEDKLKQLHERKNLYLEKRTRLQSSIINVKNIRDNEKSILIIDEYIKDQIFEIEKANKKLEKAKEKLTEAMLERKTHDKLREKAFENFMLEEKAIEGKEIDELVSYTYGQKLGD